VEEVFGSTAPKQRVYCKLYGNLGIIKFKYVINWLPVSKARLAAREKAPRPSSTIQKGLK
jgi:hypothetical protein